MLKIAILGYICPKTVTGDLERIILMTKQDIVHRFRAKREEAAERMRNRADRSEVMEPLLFDNLAMEKDWLNDRIVEADLIATAIDKATDKLDEYREKTAAHDTVLRPNAIGKLGDMGRSRKGVQVELMALQDLNYFYDQLQVHDLYWDLAEMGRSNLPEHLIVKASDKLSRPKTQLQLKQQMLDLINQKKHVKRIRSKLVYHKRQVELAEKEAQLSEKFDKMKSSFE